MIESKKERRRRELEEILQRLAREEGVLRRNRERDTSPHCEVPEDLDAWPDEMYSIVGN